MIQTLAIFTIPSSRILAFPCRNDEGGAGRLHHLKFSHYRFISNEAPPHTDEYPTRAVSQNADRTGFTRFLYFLNFRRLITS